MTTGKRKVLVCDDDAGILEVISIMLESKNLDVLALSHGKGVVKKVEEFEPSVVFLDIWMPGINGKEIIKLLKREEKTKNIPIIVISALSNTKEIATDLGADGYLAKPFDMNDLFSIIDKYT